MNNIEILPRLAAKVDRFVSKILKKSGAITTTMTGEIIEIVPEHDLLSDNSPTSNHQLIDNSEVDVKNIIFDYDRRINGSTDARERAHPHQEVMPRFYFQDTTVFHRQPERHSGLPYGAQHRCPSREDTEVRPVREQTEHEAEEKRREKLAKAIAGSI